MAAPTFVSEFESAWDTTTTPKDSGSITASTDDVIVSCAGSANNIIGTSTLIPTGTGVTMTVYESLNANDYSEVNLCAGVVASGGTVSVSTAATSAYVWGVNTLQFSGSDGIGAAEQASGTTGAPSVSITTTQANSAIVVIAADWNALNAARTWLTVNSITPTSGNGYEKSYFSDGSNYGVYVAYYPDAGAVGAKTVGLSAPTGQKWQIAAIEVLGTAGGGPAYVPRSMLLGVG